MKASSRLALLGLIALALACAPKAVLRKPAYDYSKMDKESARVHKKIEAFIAECIATHAPLPLANGVRIESLILKPGEKSLAVTFSKNFSYPAFRPDNVKSAYARVHALLGKKYDPYNITLYTLGQPIESLVPNFYRRSAAQWDRSRMALQKPRPAALVRRISRPLQPDAGLLNRTIDVRPSHGWYYNAATDRWEWQRPRLFETVEDLLPFSFTTFYLIPMLENAGAVVFTPRERDIQTHMVVVDNDAPGYAETGPGWHPGPEKAFATGHPPYEVNYNPFLQGSHRLCSSDAAGASCAVWRPEIPADGEYAVYITWHPSPDNLDDALYTVRHAGGITRFQVNQQIGGSTWIYLGTFRFLQGCRPDSGSVELSSQSRTPGRLVSADAVRFGGGMGDILRNGAVSGKPRFAEGSKYYLQFAGFPDTLIYNLYNGKDDYREDYNSRSEYANYLYGDPFGPKKERHHPGLGIPIDLTLAFHTDAGITRSDTTIGTLSIYSYQSADSTFSFPDGVSRMANRDFADVLQTQLVEDLRRLYDPVWSRRPVMDGDYSEARRPQFPCTLLELLSHQNFLDMKFALDPRFRFDTARAIYKAMLKFIAFQNQSAWAVQPLPVDHFQALLSGPGEATLSWQPVIDPLEPTAVPQGYIVYTRRENTGFDNGVWVEQPRLVVRPIAPGLLYSFKVTAVNGGGESFSSEILSLCQLPEDPAPLLVVNGFDRIAPPAWIDAGDFSGFADFLDQGVPDHLSVGTTGHQIDMKTDSPFRTNDAPGHGASQAAWEARPIAGNTFDFPALHGRSLRAAGRSFASCSDEALADGQVDIRRFRLIDLILGEEKQTHWPTAAGDSLRGLSYAAFTPGLCAALDTLFSHKGGLLLSGAYIGSDPCAGKTPDDPLVRFVEQRLHYRWTADHASSDGRLCSADARFWPRGTTFQFNTEPDERIYAVEAPDALDPVQGSRTILRYGENQFSAATAFKKGHAVVALGFPFEALRGDAERDALMRAIINFLTEP
ncbi:MAG TPA: xanthan lyase [bacterium]|nr:xanthan lyase [bacterium]